jgi:methyl-accepting chemotaxis protein
LQIVSVSSEATETGRRATEIRDGSAEIASKVDALRVTLVRVIRKSTSDVDRRISARDGVRRPATLNLQGKTEKVIVSDLSLGGAMIDDPLLGAPINTPMTLVIDGIAADLKGFVARHDATTTLVKFAISESAKDKLSQVISTMQAA